jgi:serine/threonine protein phosphatase PrpC
VLLKQAEKKINEMELEAGSTGTVCLLTLEEAKRVLYVAHVGDSSAYLFDDNAYEKLTPEHRCDNHE